MEDQKEVFIVHFQDNFHSINQELKEPEHISSLVDRPSAYTIHNSGLLSQNPVQDKTLIANFCTHTNGPRNHITTQA